jgi:hypothetical protein
VIPGIRRTLHGNPETRGIHSMSVLRRPLGDDVARKFGAYMSENDLRKLVPGDRFDILCEHGIHYVAKVVRIDHNLSGQVHFCKWNEKFDYFGSFKELYLANEGQYSAGTLNGANQYIDPTDPALSRRRASIAANEEGGIPSYAEKTRYDDDYLFKPYRNDRKRRSIDGENDAALEGRIKNETEEPPSKKLLSESGAQYLSGDSGEDGDARVDSRHPVADQGVPTVTPTTADSQESAQPSSVASPEVPSDPKSTHVPNDGTASGAANACSVQHRLIPVSINEFANQQTAHGAGAANKETTRHSGTFGDGIAERSAEAAKGAHTGVSLRPSYPSKQQQAEYVAAPNPFVVGGGKTMPRWRHYYQQMLQASGDAECRDVAAAMEWLNAHLENLRSRGTVKGKVYGPLAMLCVTHDVHSAVMLEHAMGRKLLLGFLVDRLLDQQYLEEQLVGKLGLNVKVLFSGTRDRFDGYKPLAPTFAKPVPGCELTNLGDRLMCGQLIRNIMHSEGCTGQYVLGGTLAAGAAADGAAALRNVFSRAGAAYAGGLVAYLAEEGGSEHHVKRYSYMPVEGSAHVDAQPVPLLLISEDTGGSLRLLYSYQEQLDRAETVPSHLVPASVPPAPSLSARHYAAAAASNGSSAASSSHSSLQQGRSQPGSRTGYGAAQSVAYGTRYAHASTPPPRSRPPAFDAAQSFAGLQQYDSLRASAAGAGLRTSCGTMAVWHLLTKQPGLWFTSKAALDNELQQEPSQQPPTAPPAESEKDATSLPALDSRGVFVPLSAFLVSSGRAEDTERLDGEPTLFGHTWPLRQLQLVTPTPVAAVQQDGKPSGPTEAAASQAETVFKTDAALQGSDEPIAIEMDVEHAGEVGTVNADQAHIASEAAGHGTLAQAREQLGGETEDVSQGPQQAGEAAEALADTEEDASLVPELLPLPIELDLGGAGELAASTVVDTNGGGEEVRPTANPESGVRDASTEAELAAPDAGQPYLALHRKTGALGLAFLSASAFRAWHSAVLAAVRRAVTILLSLHVCLFD